MAIDIKMNQHEIEKKSQTDIMTPRDTARFLKRHITWVYRHREELGGIKIGGALFFPCKEELYERLFRQKPGMAVQFLPSQDPVSSTSIIPHQARGSKGRGKEKGGHRERKNNSTEGTDRYGLFDAAGREA